MENEVQSLKLTCFAEKNIFLCQSMISFCFVNTEEKVLFKYTAVFMPLCSLQHIQAFFLAFGPFWPSDHCCKF